MLGTYTKKKIPGKLKILPIIGKYELKTVSLFYAN